jgi:hypothetical protein
MIQAIFCIKGGFRVRQHINKEDVKERERDREKKRERLRERKK